MSNWGKFKGSVDSMYNDSTYYPPDIFNSGKISVEDIFKFYLLTYYKPLLSIQGSMNTSIETLKRDLTRWLTYRAHLHSVMLSEENINTFLNDYDPVNYCFNNEWKKIELSTITKVVYLVRNYLRDKDCSDLYPFFKLDINLRLSGADRQCIIRPVNDKIWSTCYPPNTFNSFDDVSLDEDGPETELLPNIVLNQAMAHNSALTGRFFTENHIFYHLKDSDKRALDKLSLVFHEKYVIKLVPTPAIPYAVDAIPSKSATSNIWRKMANLFK